MLAVAGVSIYISTIDWNKHKEKLTNYMIDVTGKRVVFAGSVSLSLFPSPYLTAKNVRVYNEVNQDLEHPLMTVENLVAELSLSSLLNGSFDVRMMTLEKPKILVRKTDKGINWLDKAERKSRTILSNVNIALDSVMLDDAVVVIENEEKGINVVLDKLKAEVVADTLNGPYRIDGSYMKHNNPEGFAISIGNLSDSFATNLNFVLSQPASETYLRFDGTFLLSNEAVNGNLILESKKFKDFYDSMVPNGNLKSYLNKQLATSMELKINKEKVELANIILKYGAIAGAGSVVIPLQGDNYALGEIENEDALPVVNVKFDMTDFRLEPVLEAINEFVSKQKQVGAIYEPNFPFNMNIDFTSLKSDYNRQLIKDLALTLKLENNVLLVENMKGIFPGDTQLQASGKVFSAEDVLSYVATVDAKSNNLKKMLDWLNVPVKQVEASTYLKSSLKADIVGDISKLQIAPFEIEIDKTKLSGNFGMQKGSPNQYALELRTDSANLDNYLPPLEREKDEPLESILKKLWAKTKWANDVNIALIFDAGMIIYNNTLWDTLSFNGVLQNGILNVEKFSVADVLKTNLNLSGEVRGFGDLLQVSNLQYKVSTNDVVSLFNVLKIDDKNVNLNAFQPFNSEGVLSKNADRIWIKSNSIGKDVNISYNGRIMSSGNTYALNGDLDLMAPNASEFIKNIGFMYEPKDKNLGRLGVKAKILGNLEKFKFSNMQMSVGANVFQGTLGADFTKDKPYWVANLKVNRFEIDRFLPKGKDKQLFALDNKTEKSFKLWDKPMLSNVNFDYAQLGSCLFSSKLSISEFLVGKHLLKNADFRLINKDNELSLSDLKASYNDGEVTANLVLKYASSPRLSGDYSVTNQNVVDLGWSGDVYGLKSGMAEINSTIDSSALSLKDIFDNYSGVVSINVDKPVVKGINLFAVSEDLSRRDNGDGLQSVLLDNLQHGETNFTKLNSKLSFKDGDWMINSASLVGNDANVNVSGNGSLGAWNMDLLFKVQLSEPLGVKPFDFSLKGEFANPELAVNSEAIENVYKEKIAKIENDKKAKQEAYERELQAKIDEQKDLLQKTELKFNDFVDGEYRTVGDKLVDSKNKEKYSRLESDLEKCRGLFNEANEFILNQNIQEGFPQKIADINEQVNGILEANIKELQLLYADDIKQRIDVNYKAIQDEIANKERLAKNIETQKEILLAKLQGIHTEYRVQSDKLYISLLDSVESNLKRFDDAVQDSQRFDVSTIINETDATQLVIMEQDSASMLNGAQRLFNLLQDSEEHYFNYLKDKINELEKEEAELKKAQEDARKVEENIGTISMSATGEVRTIVRGIDEIEGDEKSMPTSAEIGEISPEDLEINLFRNEQVNTNVSGTISKK